MITMYTQPIIELIVKTATMRILLHVMDVIIPTMQTILTSTTSMMIAYVMTAQKNIQHAKIVIRHTMRMITWNFQDMMDMGINSTMELRDAQIVQNDMYIQIKCD